MRHTVVEGESQDSSSAANELAIISGRGRQSTSLSRDGLSGPLVRHDVIERKIIEPTKSAHGDGLRLLFIPVSAQQGIGEYARARELALAISQRLPLAQIHFVLNRMAPYAPSVPFETTWLPSSATFHPQRVAQLIRTYRPNLVVFDNAGRTPQLRAARDVGARIVFVSSRPRQRRKAFRLHWMRLIDEHWIAYPEFVAGSLSWIEHFKLALIRRPVIRFMDTVMPEVGAQESDSIVNRYGLQCDRYVLVVPGGGTGHPGAEDAPQVMAEAALRLALLGHQTILVGGEGLSSTHTPFLKHEPRLSMLELTALIRQARLVVTNGGDTLLQTLACRKACVATAIAGDQAMRIRRCEAAGVIVRSSLNAHAIERAVLSLLGDDARRAIQLNLVAGLGIKNGMGEALEALSTLAAS